MTPCSPRPTLLVALAVLGLAAGRGASQLAPEIIAAREKARSDVLETRITGMRTLADGTPEARTVLKRVLATRAEKARKWIAAFGKSRTAKALEKRASGALADARKRALAAIFDEQSYYKDSAVHGHGEVDKLVGVVRSIYHHPVRHFREQTPAIDDFLDAYEADAPFAAKVGVAAPSPADVVASLDRAIGLPRSERSNATARWETRIEESIEDCETEATPGEIEVVLLLNDYRRMMGRTPVAPHKLLMRAARSHSQEMETLRYFSHTSPTPERRSPTMRARLEGYGGGCAENIARAGSAKGAHLGWYGSPGHHRNMLGRHRVVGLGCSKGGGYWTQMFGSNAPPKSKGERIDSLAVYLTRSRGIPERDLASRLSLARWCKRRGLLRAMEREAKTILAKRTDHEETRALLGESRDGEGRWRHAAERAIHAVPDVPARIAAARPFLEDDDPYVRLRATRALARLFTPAAEPVVARGLKDPHPEVRAEAALGLMVASRPNTESTLKSAARDKDPVAALAAAAALYRRGNASLLKRVFAAANADVRDRAAAQWTLNFIAHQDFGYRWDLPPAERKAALDRALAWFEQQRDE